MQAKLDTMSGEVLEEKKKRRAAVAREVERQKAVENTVDKLYNWIGELDGELRDAKSFMQRRKQHVLTTLNLNWKQ